MNSWQIALYLYNLLLIVSLKYDFSLYKLNQNVKWINKGKNQTKSSELERRQQVKKKTKLDPSPQFVFTGPG